MSDSKEFKNDHLTVTVMEHPGCLVKLDVVVSQEATIAAFSKAINAVNKEVSLPGFRKGRAPKDLVLSHYKKYVEDEWKDTLLNTAFSEALGLINKYPFNKNATKQPHIKELSKETGARFTIEFETSPQVPEINPSDFTLSTRKIKEVTEEDVNEFVENLRLRSATWNNVEGRAVAEGDYVNVDIENLDEPGTMLCEDTRFAVSEKMASWMRNLLIGTEVGQQVEGTSEKDPAHSACASDCQEHDHAAHEFKPTKCRITLKSISQPLLAELNEEFFKQIKAESIEEVRENARKKLEKDAISEEEDRLKEEIKNQLASNYDFDIPGSFLSSNKEDEAKQMRLFFLTSEFAKKHQISVSNNEIYQAAMQEVVTQGELANDLLNGDERRVDSAKTILYTNILIEKVLSKILEQNSSIAAE